MVAVYQLHPFLPNAAALLLMAAKIPTCNSFFEGMMWLPIIFGAQFKILILTYKALYSLDQGI